MKNSRNILLLYIFSFFKNLLFFGAVAVPFYLHRIGLDYTRMFTLEAIFSIAMIVFEIPTGVVADRRGRKISLFWGSLFFGAGFLLFGITYSYPVLVVAEIICAFGMTMLSGADRAILYDLLKESGDEDKAAAVMSRYDAAGTAGMLLAFPAGSVAAGSGILPYKTALGLVFIATAVSCFIAGLVVLTVREPARCGRSGSALRQGAEGFMRIWKMPRLRLFSLNFAFISSLTFFMFWFYQSLLMENGFPLAWQGFVAAGMNLTALLLLVFAPVVLRFAGTKNTLFMSSVIPGVLYILVCFIPGVVMAFIAIFGVTNLKLFRAPILGALINEEIESPERATVLSGVSMIERISTTLLYPVAGLLADKSLNMAFLVIGVITVLLAVLLRVEEDQINVIN